MKKINMKETSQKTRSVQQNMIFNTAGSLIYYACQWLMTILIVRISGYEDAGVLSIAMSVTAAPAIVGLFNIRSYQVSDLEGQFSDSIYVRSRIVTNILSFLICILMIIVGGYNLEKSAVIIIFMLFKVAEGFADVYYGIEQKNERMDYAGISLTVRGIGTIILFTIVMLCTRSLFFSVLAISLFSFIVILGYDRRIVKRWNTTADDKKQSVIKLLRVCFPLAVVAFLNNLSLNIPKIYLESYFGSEVMGFYSSVASPTLVVQLAATTIFAPLIPILSLQFQERNKKGFFGIIKKFAILVLGLSVICLIGSKLLARWGLVLLFSESIEPYVYLFVPIIIISILIAINASLFSICTLIREIKSQYIIGLLGVLSAWLFSVTVVKAYSMIGVVYALAGTLAVQIIVQLMIILKKVRNYEWRSDDESQG